MIKTNRTNNSTRDRDNSSKAPYVSNLERRYRSAVYSLRQRRYGQLTKEQQTDVAYLINQVDKYGFVYQGHYVYDAVVKLEEMAEKL